MIKGNYELKVRFDVQGNGRALKELTLNGGFDTANEFLKKLLDDIEVSGPMLDRFIPSEEIEVPEAGDTEPDAKL